MPDNREIWVADAETDPFKFGEVPEPFIWGVYNGTDYFEFIGTGPFNICSHADLLRMVDFLRTKEIILYAHNGGKFDWHFLSAFFEPASDLFIINGRLARFTIGNCEFRDSFNLMPVSLDQYQKMKFDYTKMHRLHRAQHMDEIKEYLKSDCVNLWNMVTGFNNEYGVHITQASAAMKFWQTRLQNKVPRSDEWLYDFIKPYYYGGRVQCFEQGDFSLKAKSIDINSAYPYAMLSAHPYSIDPIEMEGKPKDKMKNWGPMFFCIECNSKGAFPYRGTNGSLYFPDGDASHGERRIYTVTGWELIAAIETNTVDNIKFLTHIKFNETQDFTEYVNFFWERRQEFRAAGDKGGVFYCKIFLNALYGKWAMDPRKHKQYTLYPKSDLPDLIQEMGDGDSVQDFREWLIHAESKSGAKRRFYNLATAASITGYVRAMLWRAVCHADRPLYCDTDSITAIGFGKDVILGSALGEWDIENEYGRIVICGKKLYAMLKAGKPERNKKSWKIASKGAKLSSQDLIKIAAGETVHFQNAAPTFSTSKPKPTFVSRDIKATASDIRIVPKRFDPKYSD